MSVGHAVFSIFLAVRPLFAVNDIARWRRRACGVLATLAADVDHADLRMLLTVSWRRDSLEVKVRHFIAGGM